MADCLGIRTVVLKAESTVDGLAEMMAGMMEFPWADVKVGLLVFEMAGRLAAEKESYLVAS